MLLISRRTSLAARYGTLRPSRRAAWILRLGETVPLRVMGKNATPALPIALCIVKMFRGRLGEDCGGD